MSITKAKPDDLLLIREITHETIRAVYPRYYPAGAVQFFLDHHNDDHISSDLKDSCVYLCRSEDNRPVGTVTVRSDEILRLFVLPEFQGRGYGRELLMFAEELVSENYDEIVIDASLAAKAMYLKNGYRETGYHVIRTENDDFLCYDVMKKQGIKK